MASCKLISWSTIESPTSAPHHTDGFWVEFGGYTFHSFLCKSCLTAIAIDSTPSNVNVVFMKLNVCFNDESIASYLRRITFKLNKKI